MTNNQSKTFDAIVISVRKHKEKDALVKMFTLEHGKRMFFIRNHYKSNHALKSSLLPFTYSTFEGTINEDGLCFVSDYKDSHIFRKIHEDIHLNAYATYLANLSDAAIEDRLVNRELFTLLLQSLRSMNEGMDAEIIVNIFEMNILRYFGVHLQLDSCRVCGSQKEPFDFSTKYSGVLCSQHYHEDPHRLHINPAAIYFSRLFLGIKPEQVEDISIREDNKKAIREFIDFLYDEYVGIRLKSKSYIDQMFEWENALTNLIKKKNEP
ncbi:DNA repair protein RecO [Jeotgalibaca sp. A122]|uniref:DNA repair protein RecO n=1 Tax=Jeotgalibaca sp. A122 TaxID=3457322 RepID=UPI003FD2B2FC